MLALGMALAIPNSWCEAVIVSSTLDTNRLVAGSSTVLHVFARIAPDQQTNGLQIFSWDIDLISLGDPCVRIEAAQLLRPTSDNDPETSSAGTQDGSNLRSIHDTFLDLMGAGHDQPVELFSVPIAAISPGKVTLAIQAGTGSEEMGGDFVVQPSGDGPPLIGGYYSAARVDLEITAPLTNLTSRITQTPLPQSDGRLITITFPVLAENDYVVEYTPSISTPVLWQPLPNPPHNAGFADDTNSQPRRFYRVRVMPK
jgi:hypothetical protein